MVLKKAFCAFVLVLALIGSALIVPPATATTTVETVKASFVGAGTVGPFTYPFKIWSSSDLVVIKRSPLGTETTLALNTDYTVTGVGVSTGGTVTLTAVLPVGYSLTIMRAFPYLQSQNYTSLQAITATSLNNSLDKLNHQIQQLHESSERSFQAARSSTATGPLYLEPHANWLIGWDSLGTGLKNYTTSTISIPQIDHIGNHSDSLETAITDIGATPQALLVNKGVTTLGGAVTVPVTTQLWVTQDGGITHPSGTLTVNNLTAGDYGWFTGPGLLAFGTDYSGDINARWWKAGAATWETAIAAAITAGAEGRTVSLRNATIPLTTGVQARIADRGLFDFSGSRITPASEMTALNLSYGNLATNVRSGVGRRIEQGNINGQSAFIDFTGIGAITSSVGVEAKSFSSMVIQGSSIKSAYIGYNIVPCDNLELSFPRLSYCHIGVNVPNWSELTQSMMMRFNGVITVTNDYGIVIASPYDGAYINGGTFSNNLFNDIRVTNNTPLVKAPISYNNLQIKDWHSEQGGLPQSDGTPCRKIYLDDVQAGNATYAFHHVGIKDSIVGMPVGGVGLWAENTRYIDYSGVRSVASAQVLTDASTTSGSAVVTLGTAQTSWIKTGTVTDVTTGYEKTKIADTALAGATTYVNYRLTWLTGANAGTYVHVDVFKEDPPDSGLYTGDMTLYPACGADVAIGDTFKLEKVFAGMYISGRGITLGTKILTIDSSTQLTMNATALLTGTPRAVTINLSTPVFLDANCVSAKFRNYNWGNGRLIHLNSRTENRLEPTTRNLEPPVKVAGYDEAAAAYGKFGTGAVSIDMTNRMSTLGTELATGALTKASWYLITATAADHFYTGDEVGDVFRAAATTGLDASNKVQKLTHTGFPTEAVPIGYRLRVTASDSGGSGTILFAPTSADASVVGKYVTFPLTATATTWDFDVGANFNGDVYRSFTASGGTATISITIAVVAVYM